MLAGKLVQDARVRRRQITVFDAGQVKRLFACNPAATGAVLSLRIADDFRQF